MQEFGAFGSRLQFEASGFVYAGKTYAYADVTGLEFKQQIFVPERGGQGRTLYESRLRVYLKSGKRLTLAVDMLPGRRRRTHDKHVYESMAKAAEWLEAYTFDARMDGYEQALRERGYVSFGRHQITAKGDLFRRFAFCMNLREANVRCMLYAHHLACLRRPGSWWKRILGMLINRSETLDLRRDRDCFLYFMRRHVGVHWPDEVIRLYRGRAADGSTEVPKEAPKEAPRATAQEPRSGPAQGPFARRPESGRVPPPPPPPPPPARAMPSYPQHLATLGLKPDASWEVVRTTYRQLARKHHPDLMRGRGASESAIKQAEEVLKGINEAYGWLEDFYKLKPK